MNPAPTLPSDRKFGLFMSLIFSGLAVYLYFQEVMIGFAVSALTAGLLCFFAVIAPSWLSQLNRLWFQLGVLLGKVVSPAVLGVMFFLLITPVALITRLLGRDALMLKKRSVSSYWVNRIPPGPPGDSFKNQF